MAERPKKPKVQPWHPAEDRYDRMVYRRCGASGLKLPAISLGLWHNFGAVSYTHLTLPTKRIV